MKGSGFIIFITFAAITFFTTACSEQNKPAETSPQERARVEKLETTPADIKKEARDLAVTTKTYAEEQKELYTQQVIDKLAQYNQKLIELNSKVATMSGQARAGVAAELEKLDQKKEAVASRVLELQTASGEAYEDLKEGMEKAIDEMDVAFARALSRFHE